MDSNEPRENKVEKPHAHFGDPQDVVADPALSKEEKVEALETLEQDARLLTTAAQEGMTGGEENKLQEVLDAKKALFRAYPQPTSPIPIDRREHDGTLAAEGRQDHQHAPHRRLCTDSHPLTNSKGGEPGAVQAGRSDRHFEARLRRRAKLNPATG